MKADGSEQLDLLSFQVSHEEEVPATSADLHVTIRGAQFLSGQVALQKAREVASLVQALAAVGVEEKHVRVAQVSVEVTSGLLTKSSSATYVLEIRCERLDTLADVLGAISSQKNTQMSHIEWGFGDEHALRTRLLAECARKANERAAAVAQALGVRAVLHRFVEQGAAAMHAPGREGAYPGSVLAVPKSRAMTAQDLGLAITHSKTVELTAQAEYRVAPLA